MADIPLDRSQTLANGPERVSPPPGDCNVHRPKKKKNNLPQNETDRLSNFASSPLSGNADLQARLPRASSPLGGAVRSPIPGASRVLRVRGYASVGGVKTATRVDQGAGFFVFNSSRSTRLLVGGERAGKRLPVIQSNLGEVRFDSAAFVTSNRSIIGQYMSLSSLRPMKGRYDVKSPFESLKHDV